MPIIYPDEKAVLAPSRPGSEAAVAAQGVIPAAQPGRGGRIVWPWEKERTWGQAAGDTAVQLGEGVNTILGAVPSLVAPDSGLAQFFRDNAEYWRKNQSAPLQLRADLANAAIQAAGEDGVIAQVVEAASRYADDPGLAARFVVTNLPSVLPGIGAAKLAQAASAARTAAAVRAGTMSQAAATAAQAGAATTAAGATGAVLNAGGARGEAFEDLKRTLLQRGYSEEDATRIALEDSRGPAAVGGVTGFISGRTGLESALFGVGGAGSALRRGAGKLAAELAGEQLEEVAPKVATNFQAGAYDGRPLTQDVGRTIVETAIGSGPMAAAAGVAEAMRTTDPAAPAQAPAPAPAPIQAPPPPPAAPATPPGSILPPTGGPGSGALPPVATPPDLDAQNRDRTRAASVAQMQAIEANPDYLRLGPSRSPDTGAPMVFAEGDDTAMIPEAARGRKDIAVMSDGQRVPFQYAVVDASLLQPSNFSDGTPNPLFGDKTPGLLKALNNARSGGLRGAWARGTASRYAADMEADAAQHLVDLAYIRSTPNPVLVRLYSQGSNTPRMAARSQGQGLGMSPGELARQDAPLIDGRLLSLWQGGDVASPDNLDFVRGFVGRLQGTGQDIAGMMTEAGMLSTAGRTRIQAALSQSAYGDADLINEMFESTDTDIKAIGEALKAAAPEWADMRDSARQGSIQAGADITPALLGAVAMVRRARQQRKGGLADLARQTDITTGQTPDPMVLGALRLFYGGEFLTRPLGRDRMADLLREYTRLARGLTDRGGLFGDTPAPLDVLTTLTQEATNGQQQQPGAGRPTQPVGAGGQQPAGGSGAGSAPGAGGAAGARPGDATGGAPAAAGGAGPLANAGAGGQAPAGGLTPPAPPAPTPAPPAPPPVQAQAPTPAPAAPAPSAAPTQQGATDGLRQEGQGGRQEAPDAVNPPAGAPGQQPGAPAAAPAPVTPPGGANTIFTEDAAAAARERLKAKLGRLQSGIDPETMLDGITLAGYHIERGARRFAAYARAMVDDLGDAVKPYLVSWYLAVRNDPRAAGFKPDMDRAGDVEDADIEAVLKAEAPADAPAPTPTPPPAPPANDAASPIKDRVSMPDGMEYHLFTTDKGWGVGQFDVEAGRYVEGDIVRFDGDNAEGRAREYMRRRVAQSRRTTGAAPSLGSPEGRMALAQSMADRFIGGDGFKTIVEARKFIADATGQPVEPGTQDAKLADETVEMAVVLAGREIVKAARAQGRDDGVIYDRLVGLYGLQPNLGVRTSTSVREQAYSTPVPLAFLASRRAQVAPESTVGEPTAGNTMLLLEVDPARATVNELNPDRAANARALGFKVTSNDAARTDLAPAKTLDRVVANPPFGTVKDDNRETVIFPVAPNYGTREVDHAISFKALDAMKDDGSAVLILGGVDAKDDEAIREGYRGKSKREFYFRLYNQYNVVDHFTVDGGLYSRQGAGYPVDVVVIRGRGKSARALPAADLPKRYDTWEALKKDKLDGSTEATSGTTVVVPPGTGTGTGSGTGAQGQQPGIEGVVVGAGRPGAGDGGQGARPGRGGGVGGQGAGSNGTAGQPGRRGGTGAAQPGSADGVDAGGDGNAQTPVSGQGAGGGRGDAPSGRGNRSGVVGESGAGTGERVQSGLTDRRGEEQETENQVAYSPQSQAASVGTLVPRAMRDAIAASLQRVADSVGDIDTFVAEKLGYEPETLRENFSAEQIDALALAINSAEAGKGFIIGDQTGIGKGRVVAAMLRYAMLNDRTPVFVTEKPNLYADMIRDLDDIGMGDELGLNSKRSSILVTNSSEPIPYVLQRKVGGETVEIEHTLRSPAAGKDLERMFDQIAETGDLGPYKIVFTTYNQLQTVKGNATARMRMIAALSQGGYMVFDESHNAGGTQITQARTKEDRAAVKAGDTTAGRSGFVRSLVRASYGSFFSSATYAKRPDVMDLYSSTNMMLAVDRPADLAPAIMLGGVPMQQIAATMLTEDGQYIRRERTFAGVTYETRQMKVDRATAENMAQSMRMILAFSRAKEAAVKAMQKQVDQAGGMVRAEGEKTQVEGANFGAIMHNLIDQMLLSLKAQQSLDFAIERLKAGEKVVLTVSNTMGSFLKDYADDFGLRTGDPVDLSFADLYKRYLEKQRIVKIKRPGGPKGGVPYRLTDADLGSALVEQYNAVARFIDGAGFGSAPMSPIDFMHQRLRAAGFKTDEITGREITLEYGNTAVSQDTETTKFTFNVSKHIDDADGWFASYANAKAYDTRTDQFDVGRIVNLFDAQGNEEPAVIVGRVKSAKDRDGNLYMVVKVLSTGEVEISGPPSARPTGKSMELDRDYQRELDGFRLARAGSKVAAPTLASRRATIKQRLTAIRGFNGGAVDAIILNQSGSTGLSLHASAKVKDKRKRHMIVVQAEKNIDTHMQMLGRVHRTGQVVTPAYTQAMADIPAEMRPASVLLKKMASLNANTTASRKSAVTAEGVVDFMNDYGGQVAAEFLMDNPEIHRDLGGNDRLTIPNDVAEADEDLIRKLTGYLPILLVDQQDAIMRDLTDRYNELIARENAMGTNKLEAKALDLGAKTLKSEQVTAKRESPVPSRFAEPAFMEQVEVNRTVKPMSKAEVQQAVTETLGGKTPQQVAVEMIRQLSESTTKYIEDLQRQRMGQGADTDPDKRERMQQEIQSVYARKNIVEDLLRRYQIGNAVTLLDQNQTATYGVITSIAATGKTKSPVTGTAYKFTIALANGEARSITISNGQIDKRFTVRVERGPTMTTNPATNNIEPMNVLDLFDAYGGTGNVRREKRWMVTGNLLAGFAQYPGQIISYTKEDGTTGQGVLMRRGFDFEKKKGEAKMSFRTTDEVMRFFQQAGDGATVGTPDGVLRIRFGKSGSYTNAEMFVTGSKREGGRFFLDKGLTNALGRDFVKAGAVMRARLDDEYLRRGIDYLLTERDDAKLEAKTNQDVARRVLGLPEPKSGEGGQGGATPAFMRKAAPQTETPEFKRWFGDSKVVDDQGRPLVVYHGTKRSFDAFSKDAPVNWDNAQQLLGFYFTDSANLASRFAGGKSGSNVMPVYLSIKNPKVVPANRAGGSYTAIIESDFNEEEAQKFVDDAKAAGHDGFVFLTEDGFSEYVAFRPEQIKSATGNSGEFDLNNTDIRFNRGVGSTQRRTGLPIDRVQSIATGLMSGWANKPALVVAPNIQDPSVPQALRDEDKRQRDGGATGEVNGVFHEGTVYLFSDHLRSERDVIEATFHEGLGHYGLQGLYGNTLNAVLDMINLARPDLMRPKAAEYGADLRNPAQRRKVAEEVLAGMAQSEPTLGFVRRAVAAVRTWLRENVPGFEKLRLSDDEIIRSFILPAQRFVQRGTTPAAGGALSAQGADFNRAGPGAGYEDALAAAGTTPEGIEAWRAKNKVSQRAGRVSAVQEAAQQLYEGSITPKEYRAVVAREQPIRPMKAVPKVPSFLEIVSALKPNQVEVGVVGLNRQLAEGTPAALRLDIPAWDFYGTNVVSIHDGSKTSGNAIGYGKTGYVTNADFRSSPRATLNIARGADAKAPGARIFGAWKEHDPEELAKRAQALLTDPEWTQVGTNPFRHSFFYDKADGMPVVSAEEVVQVGPLVLARGVKKTTPEDERFRISGTGIFFSRQGAEDKRTPAERAEDILSAPVTQVRPLERVARTVSRMSGLEWAAGKVYNRAAYLLNRLTPEAVKAGVVSDYGVPEAVIDMRVMLQGRQRQQLRRSGELVDKLASLTREESRIAYEWMNMDGSDPRAYISMMQGLPEESVKVLQDVQRMIDDLSKEAVRLGQLDPRSYERYKFAYLRRTYERYLEELTPQQRANQQRATKILGDQYRMRGLVEPVEMSKIKSADPEWWGRKEREGKGDTALINQKFIKLERLKPTGAGTIPLPGMTGRPDGKVLEVVYWPAERAVPTKYSEWRRNEVFEVRDVKGGKVVLWRDFTKDEREAMGEVDEARFAIARTLQRMVHDVEVGRYLESLSQQFALADGDEIDGTLVEASEAWHRAFKPGEWVRVPETKITGTSVAKYGKLAGKYLPGPIWNDVRFAVNGPFKPFGEVYSKVLSAWKISKTALTPAVHMNNVMANLVMADWHDVGAAHVAKALRIILAAHQRDGEGVLGNVGNVLARAGAADREAAVQIMNRYRDAGGDIGSWATAEIARDQMAPLLDAVLEELGRNGDASVQGQIGVMAALQKLLHLKLPEAWSAFKASKPAKVVGREAKSMIDLYQAEDDVFRLAAWLAAKEQGMEDLRAGREARRSFLDYDINAPWIDAMRRSAWPFIAFTYRAAPMLAEVAGKRPHKLLKFATLAGALNMLGVMMAGDDEEEEERRRRMLPEEKAGRVWGIVPKLIRMPWNDKNGSPVYLDIRRFVPVGDIVDTGSTQAALPVPPGLMPGGPLVILGEVLFNKSAFTGKPIVLKDTDTPTEVAAKVTNHIYKGFMPNLPGLPGTYATDAIVNAGSGKTDAFGREQSLAQAMASSVGVKLGSYPDDVLRRNTMSRASAQRREIETVIRGLQRQRQMNAISQTEFDEKVATQREKLMKLNAETREKVAP